MKHTDTTWVGRGANQKRGRYFSTDSREVPAPFGELAALGVCQFYGADKLLISQCPIRRVSEGAMPTLEGVVA